MYTRMHTRGGYQSE